MSESLQNKRHEACETERVGLDWSEPNYYRCYGGETAHGCQPSWILELLPQTSRFNWLLWARMSFAPSLLSLYRHMRKAPLWSSYHTHTLIRLFRETHTSFFEIFLCFNRDVFQVFSRVQWYRCVFCDVCSEFSFQSSVWVLSDSASNYFKQHFADSFITMILLIFHLCFIRWSLKNKDGVVNFTF